MGVAGLGHVGIHCNDLDVAKAFYRDIVGLTVTDEDTDVGMVFLSARPEVEHHELLLCGGRTVPEGALMLQQISFRCNDLGDIIDYHQRFKEHKVKVDMIVTHGNAIGIYFYDPEGNRCEVYWQTGMDARQPFLEGIDLDEDPERIMARVKDYVAKYGKTGHVDMAMLNAQDVGTPA